MRWTSPDWTSDPAVTPFLKPNPVAFARRGALVLLVNALIFVLLSLVNENTDVEVARKHVVYWVTISLSTWAIVDMGRFVVGIDPDNHWPRGPWGLGLPVLGCALGFAVGTALGDLINGFELYGPYRQGLRSLKVDLLKSAAIGAGFSGFFYLRGRSAGQQARLIRAERDLTLAKLSMLQAQLEPHMLFNTLANLRVLIALDPPRAQDMLDHMIAFLRATLDGSRAAEHPLESEFKRLSDYLALMSMRMGPRLQVHFDLPDELRLVPVPPLLLQPLVENSIRHGIEPKVAGGWIKVSARRDGPTLQLTVRDTGVGLPAEFPDGSVRSPSPIDRPSATDATHFGLTQVRERLAALHGPSAHLTLTNAPDDQGGVLATLRLPMSAPASS